MAAKAVSTINTILNFGVLSTALTKLCPITEYPDLIGAPDLLETTDLEDEQQTHIPGVKKMDAMDFKANYTKALYTAMSTNEGLSGFFELEFGVDGVDGIFAWEGTYSLGISGGGNNKVREMTITVIPSTKVVPKVV